jgi:ubiquinone/menaquinone biosynthesis C-methylase UbiE
MKVRESGMPDEKIWESFFDARRILVQLDFNDTTADVVDFGCGYGTFTVAAARLTTGIVYALDIEPDMINSTIARAKSLGLTNVRTVQRDFATHGTGLPDGSVGYAMLFNILHAEDPVGLLREAQRVLRPSGRLGVIHWNYDPSTPRGPSMDIRPRPEQCQDWLREAGFEFVKPFPLPPYHYGIVGCKRPRIV